MAGESCIFADVFVRREAFQGLQPPGASAGADEVGKVSFELIVSIVGADGMDLVTGRACS